MGLEVRIPGLIVGLEDFERWELDRFASMQANLRQGDILLDVGSELGWQSAAYAKIVGPENVCLFEPVPQAWPTIAETWKLNYDVDPRAAYQGYASKVTTGYPGIGWPVSAYGKPLAGLGLWGTLHNDTGAPQLRLDDFCTHTGIRPRGITIDVEGGELWVLQGLPEVLRDVRPLVWVSIHPAVRLKKFGASKGQLLGLMQQFGYDSQYLGVDHEEHWFFYSCEEPVSLIASPLGSCTDRALDFEQRHPAWSDPMTDEGQVWMQQVIKGNQV
jgi:FkbM family methyltransferase